jgi:hypothetical protein
MTDTVSLALLGTLVRRLQKEVEDARKEREAMRSIMLRMLDELERIEAGIKSRSR